MTQRSSDVVIVGGGIAGMTTAYYLAKSGVRSIVIERDAIGSHASGFAYGGLSPLSGFGIPGPLAEIADLRDGDAFDDAIDIVGTWSRDDKRAGTRTLLQALVDKRIGRRDQAQAWVWRLASYTRELHEEYAVQRWPETKRLLGLLVNSSGRAHGRNARRLVHAARKQDRRLGIALLAAAVSHTPEGEEVLRGARMRMARKPSAVARELLRNFPKGGKRRKRGKKRAKKNGEAPKKNGELQAAEAASTSESDTDLAGAEGDAAAAGDGDDKVAAVVDSVGDA